MSPRLATAAHAALIFLAGVAIAEADNGSAPAQAGVTPAEVRAVLPHATRKDLASATLIGRSGQLYEPDGSGGWKRSGRGGVACAVTDAMRAGGTLWALCSRAPMFERTAGIWSAKPLANRGRTRPARVSNAPLFSVGRHLYAWRAGSWQRVASSPSRITSLLARSHTRGLAITIRKELLRVSGKRWSTIIAAPKRGRRAPEVDSPVRLLGSEGAAYVVLESGAIHEVTGNKTRAVNLPAGVASYGIGGFCSGARGAVITIGRALRAGKSEVALYSFNGRTATVFGAAPTLDAGERIGLLHCHGDELLLSTNRGRVLVRDATGQWSGKNLDALGPPPTKTPPEGAKPAISK